MRSNIHLKVDATPGLLEMARSSLLVSPADTVSDLGHSISVTYEAERLSSSSLNDVIFLVGLFPGGASALKLALHAAGIPSVRSATSLRIDMTCSIDEPQHHVGSSEDLDTLNKMFS